MALGLVLCLIVSGVWLLKRIMPQVRRADGSSPVRVLSTVYLAPKQSLSLVRCGHRLVLIGVTPEHISQLAVMNDPAEVGLLMGLVDGRPGRSATAGFDQTLDEAASRFHEDEVAIAESVGPDGRHLAAAGRELRGLLSRLRNYTASRLPG